MHVLQQLHEANSDKSPFKQGYCLTPTPTVMDPVTAADELHHKDFTRGV